MRESGFFHWVLVCALVTSACDDTNDSRLDGGTRVDGQVRDGSTTPRDAGTTMDAGIAIDAGHEADAGEETDAGPCEEWGPWGNAVYVTATATEAAEAGGSVSADGRELFFNRLVSGRRNDLFVARRDSTREPFSTVTELDYLNTAGNEAEPAISPDGRTLYFHAQRPSGYTTYVAERGSRSDPFTDLRCALAGCATMYAPTVGLDPRTIYGFVPVDASNSKLLVAHRASSEVPFDAPTEVAELNVMATRPGFPSVSADGLELYYDYSWSGTLGCSDIWVATRDDVSAEFGSAHLVEELSTASCDADPAISPSGRFLVMTRGDEEGTDLWLYERTCQ